jgi:membrane-associated phospholipid phosphatase
MRSRFALLGAGAACALAFAVAAPAAPAGEVEIAGDVLQVALPAAAAGAAWAHDDSEGLRQFALSTVVTLGVTHGLKHAIDAKRPNGGGGSFPSGHTSISFCSAEFLRRRYGWPYGAPAYALASLVGYSRVQAEQHYARDVFAGALIGAATSYLFSQPLESVSLSVSASEERSTLTVACSW